ncbi:Gamma-tubulin complex component 2 [Kappamyces sp. JEL0829]|nr:Gamma-tubulin complex component 2 [Kappamyces sp. JEL0829]
MSDKTLQLHATVSELLTYLNVDQEPERFLELLTAKKSIVQGQTTPLAEKIALKAAQLSQEAPTRFVSVFERLQELQAKELEPLLYILNQVHSDPAVASVLNARARPADKTATTLGTPVAARKAHLYSTGTGLSKSRSFASLGGSTFQAGTPHHGSKLGRSQSSLFTPTSSRFLSGTTMATSATPLYRSASPLPGKTPGTTTQLFAPIQTVLDEQAEMGSLEKINLSAMSLRDQESMVMEDLLYVMLGVDGEFISRVYNSDGTLQEPMQFDIDPDLDASLADLISRILPICSYYHRVTAFVEEHSAFEYGRTHHALSASVREMVQEYHILVAQLEHQAHSNPDFTLQKLWFYLSPTLSDFEHLTSLLASIDDNGGSKPLSYDLFQEHAVVPKSGGVLLSLLAQRLTLYGGSSASKALYSHLLSECAKPFFGILKKWICNGVLDDPYHEFMIQERASLSKDRLKDDFNDVYWEQRYSLYDDAVPTFLEPYKEKILLTGKYLNVLRECSLQVNIEDGFQDGVQSISLPPQSEIVKVVDGARWLEMIETGYLKSNKILLDLLLKKEHLASGGANPRSIKTFFLLDQSDYLTHFLDLAVFQLTKPVSQVNLNKITSLLELVVRTPSTASSSDPYKDDLTIELSSLSLFDQLMRINSMVGIDMKKHLENIRAGKPFSVQDSLSATTEPLGVVPSGPLTGIDAFTLGYSVSFPLSLVLNKKIMTKYQMIFRHLFKCKYLERCLGATWLEETKASSLAKKSPSVKNGSQVIVLLASLRGKMLHFIQQFVYFMFFEVIDPQWRALESSIREVTTVEELLKIHDDFLDTCLKECMLTNPKLIVIFSALVATCNSFVSLSSIITSAMGGNPLSLEQEQLLKEFRIPTPLDSVPQIKTLEASFLLQVQSLIDCVQILGVAETARLGSLVSQLDFNSFYSSMPPNSSYILNPIVPTSGVGKTCFCNSIVNAAMSNYYTPTVGLDIRERTQGIPGTGGASIPVQLWDIGGGSLQQKNLTNAIVMADVILLFYDITHTGSFHRLESLLKTIRGVFGLKPLGLEKEVRRDIRMPYLCLVASKVDLETQRVVTQDAHDAFLGRGQFSASFALSNLKPDLSKQWLLGVLAEVAGISLPTAPDRKTAKGTRIQRSNSLVKEMRAARTLRTDEDEEQSCSIM